MLWRPPASLPLDGATIRRSRLLKGWTQSALAGRAGVSKRTIETAEAGGRVNATSLNAIAGALEVPAGELVATLGGGDSQEVRVALASFPSVKEALAYARLLAEQRTSVSVQQAMVLVEPCTRSEDRRGQSAAYALLADLWLLQAMVEPGVRAGASRSLECAQRAVELDARSGAARAQLALSILVRHLDAAGAAETFAEAQRLEREAGERSTAAAQTLLLLGRVAEATTYLREALAEGFGEPRALRAALLPTLYVARDFEGVQRESRLVKLLEPGAWLPDFYRGLASYSLRGDLPVQTVPAAAGDLGQLFVYRVAGDPLAARRLLSELEQRRHPAYLLARAMPFLNERITGDDFVTELCWEIRCGETISR